MNFDVFTFPSLISSCKKIRQLSLETAWKIMAPSFPKRPHKDCLQFVCQEAQYSNLSPILISPLFLKNHPNDSQVNVLIADPSNPVPKCSFEKLTSMAIHSQSQDHSNPLHNFSVTLDGIYKQFFGSFSGQKPGNLKSLMLKNISFSPVLLEHLNNWTMKELHLNFCSFYQILFGDYKKDLDFNSVTKLHIKTEVFLIIQSSYMFKNLKELIIHQSCSNPQPGQNVHMKIFGADFKFLEHL